MLSIRTIFLFFLVLISNKLTAQEKLEVYTPIVYNDAGHAFVEEQDYLSAQNEFAKIHPNDTLYNQVLLNRVICYRLGGEVEKALDLSEVGFELNKDYLPEFYINKVNCLDSLGRIDEAIAVVLEAEKRFPYNYDLKVTRANLYESQKDYKAAISLYQECITAEPTRSYHHLQLGSLLYDAKALTHTILPLVAAMALDPENENNLNILNSLDQLVTSNSKAEEPLFDPAIISEQFEDVDDLISNYIALSDKYTVPGKISFSVIKQIHLMMTEIEQDQDGFFSNTYLPVFKQVIAEDKFEDFTNLICYMSKSEKHQKIFSKKKDEIIAMNAQLIKGFKRVAKVKNLPKSLDPDKVSYLYNDDNKLFVMSTYDAKKDIIVGPTVFINDEGSIARKGTIDNEGNYIGEWNWYYPNGQVQRTSSFEKDELTGKTIFYNELGNIQAINHFKNNKLNGKVEYYKLIGTKYEEVDYVDDVKEGMSTGFYSGGQVYYKIPIKAGQNHGPISYFYEDGSKKTTGTFKDGMLNGKLINYFRNENISYEENYTKGELNGAYKSFYQSGQTHQEGAFKDGNSIGIWTNYNFDGSINKIEEYDLKGNKNGIIKDFTNKGELLTESFYKNGEFISLKNYDKEGQVSSEYKKKKKNFQFVYTYLDGGKHTTGQYLDNLREGNWKYYDDYGNLVTEENYKNGNLVDTVKSYYRSGQILSTTVYQKGKKNGPSISYYPNGQMSNQGYYKDNELEGRSISYYIDGNIYTDEYYTAGMLNGKNNYYNPGGNIYLKSHDNLGFKMGSTRYDKTGKVISEFKAVNGEGTDVYYYSDKKEKMGTILYKGGERNGQNLRFHVNGKPRVEATYITNNLHGEFKRYSPDGTLQDELTYEHGVLNGVRKGYYEDGTMSFEYLYENGNLHGELNNYYENGQLSDKANYNYGDAEGPNTNYTSEGDLSSVLYYEDSFVKGYSYQGTSGELVPMIALPQGTGKVETYFSNGSKSESYSMEKGSINGEKLGYYPNGKLRLKYNYKDNYQDGEQTHYYSNGNIESIKNQIYGHDNGVFKYYYDDGTIKREESYVGDERHGPTKYYNKEGKLIVTHHYIGNVIYEIK